MTPGQSDHKGADRAGRTVSVGPRIAGDVKRDLLFGMLVFVIAFLVYANSLGNGFVWDDINVIVTNPALRGTVQSLFQTIDNAGVQHVPYYRPLTQLTFLMEERLHGQLPILMHLVNILLHAANAFLVFVVARSFFDDRSPAILTALLFAVHPIHAESVNFLSGGRNTMLACFFVLLAYLLHCKAVMSGRHSLALSGAVAFLAGLYSKETALMVLLFIGAVEISSLRSAIPRSGLQAVVRLIPYAAGTVIYFAMRWITLADYGIRTEILSGLAARLADNLYIIPRYLLSVILPTSLSSWYVVPADRQFPVLLLIAAWSFIIAALLWLLSRGRSRATMFGLLWLTVFWLPVSGIVLFPSVPLADRYLYIPAIGLWIVIADQAVRWFPRTDRARRYGMFAVVVIILLLMLVTVRRNVDWKSNLALFSRLVEQAPGNAYGHANLGTAYLDRKGTDDLDLAEHELRMALTLNPALKDVLAPLGYIRMMRGDSEGARYYYSEVLAKDPSDTEALINRGIAYESLGRNPEALADYRMFLSLPEDKGMQGSRQYAEERIRELSR